MLNHKTLKTCSFVKKCFNSISRAPCKFRREKLNSTSCRCIQNEELCKTQVENGMRPARPL